MALGPLACSGSILSRKLTSNPHHPRCSMHTTLPRMCCNISAMRSCALSPSQTAGSLLRDRRTACLASRCRTQSAPRRTPLRLQCLGNSHKVAAGVVSDNNIETIDARDAEAVHLPASEGLASGLHIKNHEIARLKLDLESTLLDLDVYTLEDKAKMAKATMDRRLEKRKARADHRAAASQRDTQSSLFERASSNAQASTSSPDLNTSFTAIPRKPVARRGSTVAGAAASGSKRTSKTTSAASATASASASPTRAQRRASTRSSRTSAWGCIDREQETSGSVGVVRAKQANMSTGDSANASGNGTALGGLFKASTHLLSAAQEVELTIHIKELLRCEEVREGMKEQLGRMPQNAEWAEACGASDLGTFIDDMTVGKAAKQQMIQCNQRLVMSVARKYVGRGMDLSDLIAEGIVGLIKAIERFDHTRGFKFSTYSHWWIRQAMNRAICEQGRIVRLPVHLHEVMMKARKAEKELHVELRRDPTQAEIAGKVGISEQRLHEIHKLHRSPTALEAPIGKDGDATVADLIEDDTEETAEEAATLGLMTKDMENLLYTLSEREGDVLRLRYGLDDGREKTLEEVGRILLVTRERIRQIEFKALRKLKDPQRCSVLKSYTVDQPDGNRRGRSKGMSGSRSK